MYKIVDRPHWHRQETRIQGPNPELRMGHTAVYDPTVRCIYVFGGSKNLKWFNDVHVLDIDEWTWQLVKVIYVLYTSSILFHSNFKHGGFNLMFLDVF